MDEKMQIRRTKDANTTMIDEGAHRSRFSKLSVDALSLAVVHGPNKGEILQLEHEIIHAGRGDWCELCLKEDKMVSSTHCQLRITEKGLHIRDLQSRNGIFVNEVQILEGYLVPGVRLKIGDTVLELRSQQRKRDIQIHFQDKSGSLLGQSPAMRKIFSLIERLGDREVAVLLTGETGVGKTSVAKALHLQSKRAEGPFVEVNCGAIPENLFESEMFGYVKDAFTGANKAHKGFFEQADGGTLFLDELGELSPDAQKKLLSVLSEKKIRPIGGSQCAVDFRLIAATNRDLREEVKKNHFRSDLFYRISVVHLDVPPLRERREDIPLLCEQWLPLFSDGRPLLLSQATLEMFSSYIWPGNVRQLKNALEGTAAMADGPVLEPEDFNLFPIEEDSRAESHAPSLKEGHSFLQASDGNRVVSLSPLLNGQVRPLKETLEEVEQRLLLDALELYRWDVPHAAEALGITKGWAYNRMRKYGLNKKS
ncbi:sigma 54-interacting transcriptional regulator [Myxococcota bacterium]|nr:sigma 54-interacting transcriptional regulator [Myxococcota bacterium]